MIANFRITREIRWLDPGLGGVLRESAEEGCKTAILRSSDGSHPQIWIPDIYMYNTDEDIRHRLLSDGEFELQDNEGSVYAWYLLMIRASCPMDFSDYPRDRHVCTVVVGSKNFEASQMEFSSKVGYDYSDEMTSTLPFDVKVTDKSLDKTH